MAKIKEDKKEKVKIDNKDINLENKKRVTKSKQDSKKRSKEKEVIEDIKKDNDEDKTTEKVSKKQEIQTALIFGIIAILFLSFLIPYYGTQMYVKNKNSFEYANLTWQIEKDVDVTFYHAILNKTYNGRSYGLHNVFLRTDPRDNDIPTNITTLAFYQRIVVSSSPEVVKCNKQVLVTDAIAQISQAIPVYNKEVYTAFNDEIAANETNKPYVTCEKRPDKATVIEVVMGNESKITEDKKNHCYILTIKSCEDNFKVGEKFILEIVKQLNGM